MALGAFTVYWSLLKLGILRYSEVTAGKVIERIYTVGFMKKHYKCPKSNPKPNPNH